MNESPSLAQAWVTFIQLAVDGMGEYPISNEHVEWINNKISALSIRYSERNAKAQMTKDKSQKDNRGGKKGGANEVSDLQLQSISCKFDPIESYGPLNHGVAHRNMVHGHDSVLKIVDSDKDHEGTYLLEHEAEMYESLHGLWGKAIPSLVFSGPITMGRMSSVLTYEGKSLNSIGGLIDSKDNIKINLVKL